MSITAIVNTHGNPEVTLDTLDSIRFHLTDQILLVVDDVAWKQFAQLEMPVAKLRGFYHNYHKAPYKNVFIGLNCAYKTWPDSEWFFYTEYDCLVGGDVKPYLAQSKAWCIGNGSESQKPENPFRMPLAEYVINDKFKEIVYLLGSCMFFNKKFIAKMVDISLFERLLHFTNDFRDGFFPDYDGWDVSEHLFPTLAKHWGGTVEELAKWSFKHWRWSGDYKHYPVRWQPELAEADCYDAIIMHPIKDYNHPVRRVHRLKRQYAPRNK